MPDWSLCVSVLLQEKFDADQTVVELAELLPATDYSVTLYALYDEDPSDPVTAVATTCKDTHELCCFCSFPRFLKIFFTHPSHFLHKSSLKKCKLARHTECFLNLLDIIHISLSGRGREKGVEGAEPIKPLDELCVCRLSQISSLPVVTAGGFLLV